MVQLEDGQLVRVSHNLIRRQKLHFTQLPEEGVDIIFGVNGWVCPPPPPLPPSAACTSTLTIRPCNCLPSACSSPPLWIELTGPTCD